MDDDRDAFFGSKDPVLERSWPTELWMRVIQKAIDDLALFTRMHEDGEVLTEEDIFHANTAYSFLFSEGYTFDLGGFDITLDELLEFWKCENVQQWRKKAYKRVKALVISKRKALATRRSREDE
jgi:hypothetical protein